MKSPEEQTHLWAHDTTVRWANERTATTHNLTLKTFSFILTNTSRYINKAIQIKFIKPSTEFRHFGGNHLYVLLLWCTWKKKILVFLVHSWNPEFDAVISLWKALLPALKLTYYLLQFSRSRSARLNLSAVETVVLRVTTLVLSLRAHISGLQSHRHSS